MKAATKRPLFDEPEIKNGSSFRSIFVCLFRHVAPMKQSLLLLFFIGLMLVIIQISLAGFARIFVDYLLQGRLLNWKWIFMASIGCICLLSILLHYLRQQVINRFYLKLSLSYSTEFFWWLLSLPLNRAPRELSLKMNLNDQLAHSTIKVLSEGILNALLAALFGITLFFYDTSIALFSLFIVILSLCLFILLYRSQQTAYASAEQALNKVDAFSMNGFQNIETVKSASYEPKFFSQWYNYYTALLNALQMKAQRYIPSVSIPTFLETMANLSVLLMGVWAIMDGRMTLGMLIAVQILAKSFMEPVFSLFEMMPALQLLHAKSHNLMELLKSPVKPSLEDHTELVASASKLEGSLEIKNLSFGYDLRTSPLLNQINLSLAPGKMIALMGPPGSGKSTLVNLIAGFFEPWNGEILFDSSLRKKLPRKLIINSLAIVEQDITLFSETIKDNITLMEAHPLQADLFQASMDAGIHKDILKRKGGYDCVLEANGANLSAGQRQQIQIARALYRNPTLLILDEATCSLDPKTEAEIFTNIQRRRCACIVVTNQLNTLKNCDEILILSQGTIIQCGTYAELLKVPGYFKDLVDFETQRGLNE